MVSRTLSIFAFVAATFGCFNAFAAELDPKVIVITAPDQFKWRDPTDQASTNQVILQGDPNKEGSLYININKFKSGRFGNAHYHPKDRFITVIAGAAWRGTGQWSTRLTPRGCQRVRSWSTTLTRCTGMARKRKLALT
jgi:hypothetical protein